MARRQSSLRFKALPLAVPYSMPIAVLGAGGGLGRMPDAARALVEVAVAADCDAAVFHRQPGTVLRRDKECLDPARHARECSPAKEQYFMSKTMIAAAAALIACSGASTAQDWPTRPITLVVPFAAGGGIDVSERLQAQHISELLGQSIVVENVGGAAGTTGTLRVAKAAADGYTMLIGNSGTLGFSQSLYKRLPYNAVTDFTPVGLVSDSPRILLARKDLPVSNLQEFVAFTKANQGKMQFGPEYLAKLLPQEIERWAKPIREAGISVD
jgi:hypothetical protein